jgi:uncharacterized protein YgiM (DUF1202 family)
VGLSRNQALAGLAALVLGVGVTSACSHPGGAEPAGSSSDSGEAAEGMPDVPMLPMQIVTASSLNVRSLPSSKGTVLGTLKKGQEVRVLETKNGWKRVQSDGAAPEGWVAGEFLKGHEAK